MKNTHHTLTPFATPFGSTITTDWFGDCSVTLRPAESGRRAERPEQHNEVTLIGTPGEGCRERAARRHPLIHHRPPPLLGPSRVWQLSDFPHGSVRCAGPSGSAHQAVEEKEEAIWSHPWLPSPQDCRRARGWSCCLHRGLCCHSGGDRRAGNKDADSLRLETSSPFLFRCPASRWVGPASFSVSLDVTSFVKWMCLPPWPEIRVYRSFPDNIEINFELIYANMCKDDHKIRCCLDRGAVCNNPLKDTGDPVLMRDFSFGLVACQHTQRSR